MIYSNVTSNAIKRLGYDAGRKHCEVEFHNGRRYRLEGFPQAHFSNFVNADSVGGFFLSHVKDQFKTVELPARRSARAAEEEPME